MTDEQTVVPSTTDNSLDNFNEQQRSEWLMKGTAMPKDEVESAPTVVKEPSEAAQPEPIAPAPDTGSLQEPKGRAGQRISELLGERAALRAELAALKTPVVKSAESTPAKAAAAAADTTGEPQPPDPETWTGSWEALEKAKIAYVRDLTRWELGKGDRERATAAATAAAAADAGKLTELQAAYKTRADAMLAEEPEYADAQDIIGRFATGKGVSQLLLESEVGPKIVMHLYRLPREEALKVAAMSPAALAREITLIEAQLTKPAEATPAAAAITAPTPTTKRTSTAAKPSTELSGARAAAAGDEAEAALANGDTGAYMRLMNAREVAALK
jgi:hypothetical protein